MTTRTQRVAAALVALASMSAVSSASPDLAFDHFNFNGIVTGPTSVSIDYEVIVTNVGDMPYDLDGTDPGSGDDAIVQTFLSDTPDASGTLFAAGGTNFGIDPGDLGPGGFFSVFFSSNTANLPNPGQFGAFQWLVLDLVNTTEGTAELGNNRLIILIPTPGVASLAGIAGICALRRRRA